MGAYLEAEYDDTQNCRPHETAGVKGRVGEIECYRLSEVLRNTEVVEWNGVVGYKEEE